MFSLGSPDWCWKTKFQAKIMNVFGVVFMVRQKGKILYCYFITTNIFLKILKIVKVLKVLGGKNQAPAYSVSDKGPHDSLKPKWCFNPIPWILLVGITHHKPLPQNMCHTNGWPQQKSSQHSRERKIVGSQLWKVNFMKESPHCKLFS